VTHGSGAAQTLGGAAVWPLPEWFFSFGTCVAVILCGRAAVVTGDRVS
jgi:hypothetical protein